MTSHSAVRRFYVLAIAAVFFGLPVECRARSLQLSTGPTDDSSCKDAQDLAHFARDAAHAKNYARAIGQYKSALGLCPEDQRTNLELIQTYLDAREFADAESAAKSFLVQHPKSEAAQFFLAYSYFMEKKFQDAGQTLQKILAKNKKNPDALKLLGLTLFFYKQYVLSEQALRGALALRPNDNETLYYLGRVFYTQNNFQPAINAFHQLISRSSMDYRAYDNLALCYEAVNRIDDADAAFNKAEQIASEVNPNDDWPYANHADMLAKHGRNDEAKLRIEKALQISPQSARSQYILGKILMDENDLSGAEKHLSLSVQIDSGFAKSHYLLGRIYQRMHQPDKAQQEFSRFEQLSEKAETPNGQAMAGAPQ